MDSINIKIAGKDYAIQSLTVGQLEQMHVGVLAQPNADPQVAVKEWWQQTRLIILLALAEDHPEVTAETVAKMRLGNLRSAKKVRDQILIFAGFQDEPKDEPEENPKGEAPAAAA